MLALLLLATLGATPRDCHDDLECFRKAAATCAPAVLKTTLKLKFMIEGESATTYTLLGPGESKGTCHATVSSEAVSVHVPDDFPAPDGGRLSKAEASELERIALEKARADPRSRLDCDIVADRLIDSIDRQSHGSFSTADFPGCGPMVCEPLPFPLAAGCSLGRCVRGKQTLVCGKRTCVQDDQVVLTNRTCTLGCTERGAYHRECVDPPAEPAARALPPLEPVPEYPATWEAYSSRQRALPTVTEPFLVKLDSQGPAGHGLLRIEGTLKEALVTSLVLPPEHGPVVLTRGKLNAAAVKKLHGALVALRPWDMERAEREVGLRPGDPRERRYTAFVRLGEKTECQVNVLEGCPTTGRCPQRELIDLLQATAVTMKKEAPVATRVVQGMKPPSPRGPGTEGKCSSAPARDDWFTCDDKSSVYDHCLRDKGGLFSCYPSPFDPPVVVRAAGTRSAEYLSETTPWALELASGERCTHTHSSGWKCSGAITVADPLPGRTWAVEVYGGRGYVPVKAIYR